MSVIHPSLDHRNSWHSKREMLSISLRARDLYITWNTLTDGDVGNVEHDLFTYITLVVHLLMVLSI
jgi:hypothetical protein